MGHWARYVGTPGELMRGRSTPPYARHSCCRPHAPTGNPPRTTSAAAPRYSHGLHQSGHALARFSVCFYDIVLITPGGCALGALVVLLNEGV